MSLHERLSKAIRTYPYRERIPFAIGMLCILGWILHASKTSLSAVDRVCIGVLILSLFCRPRGRPFWFFWGIVAGAWLVELSR